MTRQRAGLRVIAAAVAVLVASGCGVQLQSEAVPVPERVIPSPLRIPVPEATQPPVATTTAPLTSTLRLWFVQEDGLAAAESPLPTGTPPDLVLQALVAGPSAAQAVDGLRTLAADPLTGVPFISVDEGPADPDPSAIPSASASAGATPAADFESLRLSSAFSALPPGEQVLLLGQVVLSLTGAGSRAVVFTDEAGATLAVPLPDGRLLDGPATARDYAGLIVRP